MFQAWRFTLKQAEEAVRQQRLEDAAQLLTTAEMRKYLPAQQLLAQVAELLAERGLTRALQGDRQAGWQDLERAKTLGGETAAWAKLRQQWADLELTEIENRTRGGDFTGAIKRAELLSAKKISGLPTSAWIETIRRIEAAQKLAERGKLPAADQQLAAAQGIMPQLSLLAELRQQNAQLTQRSKTLTDDLHRALTATEWGTVLKLADELLTITPDCHIAREARKQAWEKAGTTFKDSRQRLAIDNLTADQRRLSGSAEAVGTSTKDPRGTRFLLWVDAVGGFLVCLGDEITLGQAVPGGLADVPLQADLSRQHARVRRTGEGYILEPCPQANGQPWRVRHDGQLLRSATLLADGDEFELGDGVRLRFRKPHVLSNSARLEILSQHRTHPFADSILLMAESCVLGPKWQNHVVCRDWQTELVLYRQQTQLFCRSLQSIEIDGQWFEGRGAIHAHSRIQGGDFSLALEPLA